MKKNKTWRFTKTLKCVMKEETWKKTPSKDFQEEDYEEVFWRIIFKKTS